ncbi:hypothetical protein ACFL3N_03015, partial [Candidatus Omnitrophota bacterium]
MKRFAQIAALSIFGIAAGLLLCEGAIRVLWNMQLIKMDNLGVISYEFMREVSDPDLPFELKPDIDLLTGRYHIVTNKDGFRDREYPLKKPDNVMRALVIGDSITFGYSIKEDRDIYYNLLEEMLNE